MIQSDWFYEIDVVSYRDSYPKRDHKPMQRRGYSVRFDVNLEIWHQNCFIFTFYLRSGIKKLGICIYLPSLRLLPNYSIYEHLYHLHHNSKITSRIEAIQCGSISSRSVYFPNEVGFLPTQTRLPLRYYFHCIWVINPLS